MQVLSQRMSLSTIAKSTAREMLPATHWSGMERALRMKVADSQRERHLAFQLVHDVYRDSGLAEHDPSGIRVMRQHLADTTRVINASIGEEVVFTVTLVEDSDYGLPMESLFGEEVEAIRRRGVRFAEVSCLASRIDRSQKRLGFETLVNMVSLMMQSARRQGIEQLLWTVHPRHAKTYQRLYGCVPVSGVRSYAAVRGNPAVMCVHDFAELDQKKYRLYDRVYGPRYERWQLEGTGMTEREKTYYEQFLPAGEYEVVPMAA